MKVALVHDYLREYGDAERILRVLHRIYPDAPLYTAFVDWQRLGVDAQRYADWDIRPTIAQRLPGIARHYPFYRPWSPYFWESLDLSAYDLVISSSGSYLSHAVLTRSHTLHISDCHTPPRHLWEPTRPQTGNLPGNLYRTWANTRLRQYDFYAAQRVDRFVTHSERAARRIHKFYRRAVEVIPPPVQVRGAGSAGNQYYLYVGQLNPRQQVDLVVAACSQLDRPLWIVGKGSEEHRLRHLATGNIRFLGAIPDEQLPELYAGAIALIYPSADDDFGFAAVEAMGCGVPTIACQLGGLSEVILDYRTGLLFPQPTVESVCEAIAQFEKLRFSAQACIQRAEEFAESVFISKFAWFVAKAMDDHHTPSAIANNRKETDFEPT